MSSFQYTSKKRQTRNICGYPKNIHHNLFLRICVFCNHSQFLQQNDILILALCESLCEFISKAASAPMLHANSIKDKMWNVSPGSCVRTLGSHLAALFENPWKLEEVEPRGRKWATWGQASSCYCTNPLPVYSGLFDCWCGMTVLLASSCYCVFPCHNGMIPSNCEPGWVLSLSSCFGHAILSQPQEKW